ncbi:MAG TPA: hypothetical protein VKY31_15040 [Terriglobia bacterium]|nr:hypothetical protein [Terriglobia bacterium]
MSYRTVDRQARSEALILSLREDYGDDLDDFAQTRAEMEVIFTLPADVWTRQVLLTGQSAFFIWESIFNGSMTMVGSYRPARTL